MSEFWVSGKKFWCKFCRTYVQDNKISRQNHDAGQKHKDKVKMYLRNIEIEASKNKTDAQRVLEAKQAKKPAASSTKIDIRDYGISGMEFTPEELPTRVIKRQVHETRVGEWQIVETKPTSEKDQAKKDSEDNKDEKEDTIDIEDEDDLSTFQFKEKVHPTAMPKLFADPLEPEIKEEPADLNTMFKKRKTTIKSIRKKT